MVNRHARERWLCLVRQKNFIRYRRVARQVCCRTNRLGIKGRSPLVFITVTEKASFPVLYSFFFFYETFNFNSLLPIASAIRVWNSRCFLSKWPLFEIITLEKNETYFQNEYNAVQSLQDIQSFRLVQNVRDTVVPVGRVIVGRLVVVGAEERPDGVELENNLFEPELVGCDNRNACAHAIGIKYEAR